MPSSVLSKTIESQMIKEASVHVHAAEAAMRKGCEHALLAGMRLIWLHSHTAQTPNGPRVSRDTREGFEVALEKIGLQRRTAYRWMNATFAAAAGLGIDQDSFPTPESSAAWHSLETSLKDIAGGMSLNRLLIGHSSPSSEDHRQDEIISRIESGEALAEEMLEKVAAGQLTWVQAIRALAGAEATKGKERKDPVYLDFDIETKRATGLLPKALITLQNGFRDWDTYTTAAKTALRAEWQETRLLMPDDLFSTSKK